MTRQDEPAFVQMELVVPLADQERTRKHPNRRCVQAHYEKNRLR